MRGVFGYIFKITTFLGGSYEIFYSVYLYAFIISDQFDDGLE